MYILTENEKQIPLANSPSGWWLHHALHDLATTLEVLGTPLVFMKGDPVKCFEELASEIEILGVSWNRCYEPGQVDEEERVKQFLAGKEISIREENSLVLVEPDKVLNNEGKPYKVYSAFARAWSKEAMPAPVKFAKPESGVQVSLGISLDDLGLPGGDDRFSGMEKLYQPTRAGAESTLQTFLDGPMASYKRDRDFPAIKGTSFLSPYLHWGQIGPREIYARVSRRSSSTGSKKFISEVAWREFAYYILHHFPHTVDAPFRDEFTSFPWNEDGPELQQWKEGKTGFPLVDAGMRQLNETGYVHNRVRMLVASVLVKHLMISWRTGAEWFMNKLIDADLANNTLGWQWTAGCGVDAAPYFRVFNPVLQGKKFDKKGEYIRKFVPELQNVPDNYLHEPWTMPESVQEEAGCIIEKDYPSPVVGLMEGRIRALSAWKEFNDTDQQELDL